MSFLFYPASDHFFYSLPDHKMTLFFVAFLLCCASFVCFFFRWAGKNRRTKNTLKYRFNPSPASKYPLEYVPRRLDAGGILRSGGHPPARLLRVTEGFGRRYHGAVKPPHSASLQACVAAHAGAGAVQ